MLKGMVLPKCPAAGRAPMSLVLLFSRAWHERAVPKCPHSQGSTYPQDVRKKNGSLEWRKQVPDTLAVISGLERAGFAFSWSFPGEF